MTKVALCIFSLFRQCESVNAVNTPLTLIIGWANPPWWPCSSFFGQSIRGFTFTIGFSIKMVRREEQTDSSCEKEKIEIGFSCAPIAMHIDIGGDGTRSCESADNEQMHRYVAQ